jgi:outer membrane immunogenic protein
MTRPVLAALAFLAMITGAAAADLSPHVYTKAPAAETVYNWTGFYVGLNAGYAWGTADPSTTTELTPTNYWNGTAVPQVNTSGVGQVHPKGFVGGGQIGYNVQSGMFVSGIEADFDALNLRASHTSSSVFTCCGIPYTMTQRFSTDWLSTVRGRFGVAANNWLFYATTGVAFTRLSNNSSYIDSAAAAENVTLSGIKTGWTAGAGVEVGVARNWTVRAEYLHADFGNITNTTLLAIPRDTCNCTRMFHSVNLTADMVRAGLNYKFD